LLYDYTNGLDPNVLAFSCSFFNQYASSGSVTGSITVLSGFPYGMSVLVDNTNFPAATWTAYATNIVANLGSTQGSHDVWVGLEGSPTDPEPTWEETTIVLDSASPSITITNPANNVSFNASRVNVSGSFTAATVQQISVNGVMAFVTGTNFEAVNVPLEPGANVATAVIENLAGMTNSASITITATTNTDGSLNNPAMLTATPVAGFAPLIVSFSIQANAPGTMQHVLYDLNGDGIPDFITNTLGSFNNTYTTNGEYFPFVTIQTSVGSFSSVGGWNAVALDGTNLPVQINVQPALTQTVFASITDPVALKWAGTNLYVLSGSSATIKKYNASGSIVGTLTNLGTNPTGFDVDSAGNILVAITSSNQIWRFIPTNSSYMADPSFGLGGFIGDPGGASGANTNQFNAPFDVAVSPDGGTISISDSGNNRIQQFDYSGNYMDFFGTNGTGPGQFNALKGLTYDASGTLYIVDSGNDSIILAQGPFIEQVTGTNGTALGQFSGPLNISTDERGIYVADTGNNRIQCFSPPAPNSLFNISPSSIRFAISSGLNQPAAVGAEYSFTNETFYVADTANNRVLFYSIATDNLTPTWTNMTAHVASGDINGALSFFSVASVDQYRQAFYTVGTANALSAMNQIGSLIPVYINNDRAEYYFTNTIDGQTIGFPVEFDSENGVWKIFEF
jgi:hypothetical protein